MKTYQYSERTRKVNYTVKAMNAKSAKNKINKHQGFVGSIRSGHVSTYLKNEKLD